MTNERRALTIWTNERRVLTVLTNERRAFTTLYSAKIEAESGDKRVLTI